MSPFEAPPIHDISTDLEDPPRFVAAARIRSRWQNSPEHGGERVAAAQRRAYPDIAPLATRHTPAEVYERARHVMEGLGWRVLGEDAGAGLIEAVDITPLLRFRDDVVVRIRAEAGGSRIDVRSASRLGRGDLGANAARVRRFLKALAVELNGRPNVS